MASVPFMRQPEPDQNFEIGDPVQVFCDHDKGTDRVRDWIEGIIVQVDSKLVAIQFNENVYLTEGWMVPDRILWFPFDSKNLRPVQDLDYDF